MIKIIKYGLVLAAVLAAGCFSVAMIFAGFQMVVNSETNSVVLPVPQSNINDSNQVALVVSPANINKPAVATENLVKVVLSVPYINESPDNSWTGPWKNACEEASITMVDKYFSGLSSVSIEAAKKEMSMLFDVQNKLWGGNANSDAARTARLINENTVANAIIIEQPTIEQIKKELQGKRPVITPLYGFDLHNPNIPFVPAPRGTSYHMLVVIGYDDSTKEFITNDTGDTKAGPAHRYGYDLFMNAIHDYSFVTKQADGPARAIFTYPKLVKLTESPKVFYIHDSIIQYIPSESVFKAKGWTWAAVNVVTAEWLDTFKLEADVE